MGLDPYVRTLQGYMGVSPLDALAEVSPDARVQRVLFAPAIYRDLCVTLRYVGSGAVIESVVAPAGARARAMHEVGLHLGEAPPPPQAPMQRRVFTKRDLLEPAWRSLASWASTDRHPHESGVVAEGLGVCVELFDEGVYRHARVDGPCSADEPDLMVALSHFLEVARLCLARPEDLRVVDDIESCL